MSASRARSASSVVQARNRNRTVLSSSTPEELPLRQHGNQSADGLEHSLVGPPGPALGGQAVDRVVVGVAAGPRARGGPPRARGGGFCPVADGPPAVVLRRLVDPAAARVGGGAD